MNEMKTTNKNKGIFNILKQSIFRSCFFIELKKLNISCIKVIIIIKIILKFEGVILLIFLRRKLYIQILQHIIFNLKLNVSENTYSTMNLYMSATHYTTVNELQ